MNIISERLKELRKNSKLSQREVAQKIGVSTSVIGDIECGRRIPSKRTAIKLSELFSTKVEYWRNENAEIEYIEKRSKYDSLDNVINYLIQHKKITQGNIDHLDNEIWSLIKNAISIDVKLMLMKKEE